MYKRQAPAIVSTHHVVSRIDKRGLDRLRIGVGATVAQAPEFKEERSRAGDVWRGHARAGAVAVLGRVGRGGGAGDVDLAAGRHHAVFGADDVIAGRRQVGQQAAIKRRAATAGTGQRVDVSGQAAAGIGAPAEAVGHGDDVLGLSLIHI